jgi:hypothetical protein
MRTPRSLSEKAVIFHAHNICYYIFIYDISDHCWDRTRALLNITSGIQNVSGSGETP